jgi:hypothetical protein
MSTRSSGTILIGPPRPRPNTTPHPASSSRLVRGLGVSGGSTLSSLTLEKRPGDAQLRCEDDSVVVDDCEIEEEAVETCTTPPRGSNGSQHSSETAHLKQHAARHADEHARKSAASSSSGGALEGASSSRSGLNHAAQSSSASSSSLVAKERPAAGGAPKTSSSEASDRQRPVTAGPAKPRVNLAQKALIGRGSFGVVYQAMDRDTNHIIAVKEIILPPNSNSGSRDGGTLQLFRKEIALLRQLDHPNIVKCLGEDHDDRTLRIYMEYVTGGSISSILRIFGPLSEKQASIFGKQMLQGLLYLHSRNICHRDLKGDNLLVDTKGNLKLADFGTARELASQATSVAGTSYFMAPEVIRGTGHGVEADIWSCGCCIVEMLTGKPPFSHLTNQYAVMMHVADSSCEVEAVPPSVSPACRAFLKRCFVRSPDGRATAAELLQHEWIVELPQDSADVCGDSSSECGALLLSPSSIRRVQMDTLDRARSSVLTTDSVNPLASFNDTV